MKTTFIFPDGSEKEVDFDSKTNATFSLPSGQGKIAYANGKLWFVHREDETTSGTRVYLRERFASKEERRGYANLTLGDPKDVIFDSPKTDWMKHDEVGQMELKPKRKRWEYHRESFHELNYEVIDYSINEHGKEGWELILIDTYDSHKVCYFKREIID